ncbi:uncharacterized protein LOC130718067 [Lotus japonicus]|uniref:uncharacterized protein LOC130718067 n=1 Tax=Lotus japonicus TaxID=34305 RepID=UPI00258D55BE|nr:uncharacterized protein LOC130718067 [Lotus japonicus]
MAKKKLSHHHQSQSNDHKPSSMEDPSHQIQNLKNLNSVLLKETTNHRHQIDSLRRQNHQLVQASDMDVDNSLALELQNGVISVFTVAQMREVVGEKEVEVAALKGEMKELALRFEDEKMVLGGERDLVKSEGEGRERKLKEELWVMKLEGEKLMEEISEKEKAIEELVKERDLGLVSSKDSALVVEGLKEEIERVVREKDEIERLKDAQVAKALNLDFEVRQLGESLKVSRDEEVVLRGKILELEESVGLAVEKGEEMARENGALVSEKKEMEKSIEVLTEKRDSVNRVLDKVQGELESKQRELDEANRALDEMEQVKARQEYEIAELQGELGRLRGVVDELKGSCKEFEEKNEQLVSQVNHYRDAVDEVTLEKDNMRKGFEEEKNKVEKLELQIAGMEKKIEQAESELGKMRSEREKLNEKNEQLLSQVNHYRDVVDEVTLEKDNLKKGFEEEKNKGEQLALQVAGIVVKAEQAATELWKMRSEREKLSERNKELVSNVDVLKKEKEALQNTLLDAQRESADLSAKIEFFCINSNQALAMLKSTAALVCHENNDVEEVVRDGKKLAGEIQPYAAELDTIKNAFKSKTEIVDDLKQQIVSLQKNVDKAHKGKGLLTMISSASTIFAAVLAAYVAKGR